MDNQRFQSLLDQVGIELSQQRVPETGLEYQGTMITREELEQFAEAIIHKFEVVVKDTPLYRQDEAFTWKHAVNNSIVRVRDYFGVK